MPTVSVYGVGNDGWKEEYLYEYDPRERSEHKLTIDMCQPEKLKNPIQTYYLYIYDTYMQQFCILDIVKNHNTLFYMIHMG